MLQNTFVAGFWTFFDLYKNSKRFIPKVAGPLYEQSCSNRIPRDFSYWLSEGPRSAVPYQKSAQWAHQSLQDLSRGRDPEPWTLEKYELDRSCWPRIDRSVWMQRIYGLRPSKMYQNMDRKAVGFGRQQTRSMLNLQIKIVLSSKKDKLVWLPAQKLSKGILL